MCPVSRVSLPYQTLTMFTEILAAGAMGVSVFFAIKAYSLLKEEQAKDAPRATMLRSIYVFMGFALLMTPMALGIEYARHGMNLDNAGVDLKVIAQALMDIENKTFYSVDRNGNPEAIEVPLNGTTYQLSVPFPESGFKSTHLKLNQEGRKFLALKNNNGEEITYGYLSEQDIKRAYLALPGVTEPINTDQDPILSREKLIATGLMYTPRTRLSTDIQRTVNQKKANKGMANRFLIDFVNEKNLDKDLQEQAVKILIQPTQMTALDAAQYDKLIDALSADGPRNAPWRHYELAQVYWTRASQNATQEDRDRYFSAMCAYKRSYESLRYLSSSREDYPTEYRWYQEATKDLKLAKCDQNCNCVEK